MEKIKGLKEGTIHAGDQIDQWIVDEEIGGTQHPCVYKVHDEKNPGEHFAMKIREPSMKRYFNAELKALKKINEEGTHKNFQRLRHYSKKPHKLYFIFDPYMPPENNFFKFSLLDINTNFQTFLHDFIKALRWGAEHGVLLGRVSPDHLFMKDDGITPFLLGLADEPKQKEPVSAINMETGLIGAIGQRFVDAEKARLIHHFQEDSVISVKFE